MYVGIRNSTGFWKLASQKGPASSILKILIWGMGVAVLMSSTLYAEVSREEIAKQQKLFRIREAEIPLLEKFIKNYPESPRIPESLFQLGEAYFEAGKFYQLTNKNKEAEASNAHALQKLEDLRKNFTNYNHLDQALFVLANAYIEKQNSKKAGEYLAEIAEKFPKSGVLKDAALLLGDYYFSKNDNGKAEHYYLIAITDPKNQSYANYKLAWTALNTNRPQQALQYFEKVLSLGSQPQSGGDYSKDAAHEMIWAAYQVYSLKGVLPYFDSVLKDPVKVEESGSLLARALFEKAAFAASSELYEALQAKFPQSHRQTEWIQTEIRSEEGLGRTSKVGALVARLNPQSAGSEKIEAYVLNAGKRAHAEAKKSSNPQEKQHRFDVAIGYYKAYLEKANAATAETSEVKYLLADALFARGHLGEAANNYEEVAKASSVNPKTKTQSAWSWFITEEQLAEGFHYQGKEKKALGVHDSKYLEAAKLLQSTSGMTTEQKRKASYQTARLLYQLNDTERALPVFQYLAENQAQTAEGKLSAELVLDIYNLKKDYQSVAKYARAFQTHADSGRKAELGELEEKALLKSLEQEDLQAKSKSGEDKWSSLEAVAKRYVEFATQYPHSHFAAPSLWTAVQNFAAVAAEHNDKEFVDLRQSYQRLQTHFSTSHESSEAKHLMAKFLLQTSVSPKVLQEFASLRSEWLSVMNSEPVSQQGKIGMLIYKISDDSQKRSLVRRFVSLPLSESNREAYAYGRLEGVTEQKLKLEAIELNSLKTLKRKTSEKIKALEKLQSEVTALVKLRVAEPAVQALELLGDSYYNMAQSFRSAPVPTNLSGEARGKYENFVEEKARVFESKGEEARNLAKQKAEELKLSS